MNEDEELTPEDHALLAALAALTAPEPEAGSGAAPSSPPAPAPGASAAPPGAAAETETLTRLYLETLGLVPYALPPVPPRSEVRRRLVELIAATPASGSAAPGPAPAAPSPAPAAPDLAPPAPSLAPPAIFTAPAHRPPGPARPSRWPLALAAALILALLAVCGWLASGLREQAAVVARLDGQRNAALRRAGEMEARLGRLSSQVASMRDSLAVVTSPAAEVCNLRPVAAEAGDARGILFVAADHQHWTLSLRGLRPPGGGKVYQLWFVADQGMVSAGTFDARPGEPTELASAHMPAGTKGVKVTLEDGPGAPAPSGPDVLRNADALHTL